MNTPAGRMRPRTVRLGIPDDHFNYDDFVKEEFGPRPIKPRGIHWIWWLTALALIGLFLVFYFH